MRTARKTSPALVHAGVSVSRVSEAARISDPSVGAPTQVALKGAVDISATTSLRHEDNRTWLEAQDVQSLVRPELIDTPFQLHAQTILLHSLRESADAIRALQDVQNPTEGDIAMVIHILLRAGLSQSDCAAIFQTSKTTIARWLSALPNQPRPIFRRAIIVESLRVLEKLVASTGNVVAGNKS